MKAFRMKKEIEADLSTWKKNHLKRRNTLATAKPSQLRPVKDWGDQGLWPCLHCVQKESIRR